MAMKVRRYFAASMRNALEMVRQEQGPDVLILSNKKVEDGVELITADGDIDDELVQKFADQAKQRVQSRDSSSRGNVDESNEPESASEPNRRADSIAQRVSETLHTEAGATLWSDGDTLKRMQEELAGLRELVEQQMCGFAWSDYKDQKPTQARLLREFARAGIFPTLARDIVARVPEHLDFDDGWQAGLNELGNRVQVLDDPILSKGGCATLCGPTGVGKSLIACKLAAQFALEHGADTVALISTDDQRLGAQQQLKTFGSLLGIAVYTARDVDALESTLETVADKRLIIIDSAGAPVDDFRGRELMMRTAGAVENAANFLVLSATTDYLSLSRILSAASDIPFNGCILTKIDEAAVLGPAVSAVIEAGMPVAYLSAGQNVPDDLEAPLARHLVDKTIALGQEAPGPDDAISIEQSFAR